MSSKVIIAGAIALLCIGGALYFSDLWSRSGVNTSATTSSREADERIQVREGEDAPALGRSDAKVVLIAFADFQCPSCTLFHFGAGAAISEEYIKKGKARFVFKQFPMLGEESFFAAYASKCAQAEGKFWEYHDLLFTKQSSSEGENTGTFSFANLTRAAQEIGLNKDAFGECVRSERYKAAVLQDIQDGKKAGVQGTPTVFINGRKMTGALPFAVYKKAIEEELR